MTELPHVFVHVRARLGGANCEGVASEGLPPKWFTKNPKTKFEDDLPEMLDVIRSAADFTVGTEHDNLFQAWHMLYREQERWRLERKDRYPPLLAHLGTALIERALVDAFCHGMKTTFADAVRENAFGIDLGTIHPELAGTAPADWLPQPSPSVIARHTIGLGDPLRKSDVPPEERIGDGLPHSLAQAVERYGLTHFKIKVSGSLGDDIRRLIDVSDVLQPASPGFRFTLDGNEQFRDVAAFREHWEAYRAEKELRTLFDGGGLLFVEQPLHRDVALDPRVADDLAAWPEAPPMIIDESDGELSSMREALRLGYRGTSHKNCKGVIKGIANRCLIEWYRRTRPEEGPWIMSGEDLANVGPVALLNDLAVMATLGIEGVERNGHHYFKGLSMYPEALQKAVCEAHPDLYAMRPEGYAALVIEAGKISTKSLLAAPFGHGLEIDSELLELLGSEGLPDPTAPSERP